MSYADRMSQTINGECPNLFGSPKQQFKRRKPRTAKVKRMLKLMRYLSRAIHGN